MVKSLLLAIRARLDNAFDGTKWGSYIDGAVVSVMKNVFVFDAQALKSCGFSGKISKYFLQKRTDRSKIITIGSTSKRMRSHAGSIISFNVEVVYLENVKF